MDDVTGVYRQDVGKSEPGFDSDADAPDIETSGEIESSELRTRARKG